MTRHRLWRSVRLRRRGPTLSGITRQLRGIERQLAARRRPSDVQQAIEDIFNVYGQVAQMREVVEQLVAVLREHDRNSRDERAEIKALLVQLRELARKLVRAQEDLARAVGGGDGSWSGEERRRAS
jgi:ABC-type transporter Mla subunit MlaD